MVDFERFMAGLREGTLKHSGDVALTWHALNAIARIDRYGSARFDRPSPPATAALSRSGESSTR